MSYVNVKIIISSELIYEIYNKRECLLTDCMYVDSILCYFLGILQYYGNSFTVQFTTNLIANLINACVELCKCICIYTGLLHSMHLVHFETDKFFFFFRHICSGNERNNKFGFL